MDLESMAALDCETCQRLLTASEDDYVVAQSTYWRITLAPDQYYLGRCYVTSLRHVPELSKLSQLEGMDLLEVMRALEDSMKLELGATHVTWAALMNNSYRPRDNPRAWRPHVHWHVRPRYASEVTVGDVTQFDEEFGYHHQRDVQQKLLPYQMEEIVTSLRSSLPPPWWSAFR